MTLKEYRDICVAVEEILTGNLYIDDFLVEELCTKIANKISDIDVNY